MKHSYSKGYLFLMACGILFSCGREKQEKLPENTVPVKRLTEPLHFAKSLEVSPGLTFDVISWGRGTTSGGAWLILRSDSTHLKYRTASGELDGQIVDAWNMDMDADGNPEIFIQAKGKGEGSYLNLYVYEFNSSGEAAAIHFPELSDATKKSYRGQDSVYIKDGKLRRSFPLYKETDNTTSASDGKKVLEYDLQHNSFTVKEITGESPK